MPGAVERGSDGGLGGSVSGGSVGATGGVGATGDVAGCSVLSRGAGKAGLSVPFGFIVSVRVAACVEEPVVGAADSGAVGVAGKAPVVG